MTPTEMDDELAAMGLQRGSAKLLALLPLVEVAWADGAIQDSERSVILDAARGHYGLDEAGLQVLDGWLSTPPLEDVVARGRRVLAALCAQRGVSCRDVISLSREVARAAGGWFGFGVIDANEARVIDEVARALQIPAERAWTLPEDPTYVPGDADAESEGPLVRVTFHCPPRSAGTGATLIHYDPDRGDQVCAVGDLPVTIGRADDNIVQIEFDAQVSRHHCEIGPSAGGHVLRDLASGAGTWVDGKRVTEHVLADGQTIHIGSTTLFFQND